MLGHSKVSRTLIAALGSLLMSTVAVGSAVGPAQVASTSAIAPINA